MTRSLIHVWALASLALVLPTTAVAQPPRRTVAPPGASGIAQYLEVVPTAKGPAPPAPAGGPSGAGQGGALTESQRRQLDRLGPDGRTLVAVVDATAPQSAAPSSGAVRRGTGPRAGGPHGAGAPAHTQGSDRQILSGPSDSPTSLILGAAGGGGGGGLGLFLPAFMLTSALVAVGYAVRRRRMHP